MQPLTTKNDVQLWKERIYRALVNSAVVVGGIAYIPSVYLSFKYDLISVAILDTVAYAFLLILRFVRLPYVVRVYGFLAVLFCLGVFLLLLTGPFGAGTVWLFSFPVIAGVLLNFKKAVACIVICALTVLIFSVLLSSGLLNNTAFASYTVGAWNVTSVNLICVCLLTTLPISVLVRGLERALEEAAELSRMKSSFVANMSHEFRTPINGILGVVDIIDEEVKNENLQGLTALVRESAERLMSTMDSILEISRKEAEGKTLKLGIVRPDEILKKTLPVLEILAVKKGLEFTSHFSAESCTILLDESIYVQVINNLVGNAIKFTEAGSVSVETHIKKKENGKMYHCTVIRDTGIGIDTDFQKRIFSPFEQESTGYGRKYGGTGLGLAIVKKYTQLFGGDISFSSVKGRGTEFEVAFPCSQELLSEFES